MNTLGPDFAARKVTTPRPHREGTGGGSAAVRYRWFATFFLLLAGVGMAVAGFCVEPSGSISESVLMFTAQCFICAGSFVGIDVLLSEKLKQFVGKQKRGEV